MNIGQRIKNMRLKNNLTQDELALSIGTTKQTIHKYENGIITNIPSSKIEAIANILNTTPNYLMGWTEEESKVHTTLANLRIFFLKQDYNIYEEIMKKANTSMRLKEIMEKRGLKQIDILNSCRPYCKKYDVKLSKGLLSQYVNGSAAPGQDKLYILARALNVNEAWLMGFDVPPSRGKIVNDSNSEILALLEAIPEQKKENAIEYLKFLSNQNDK